MSYSKTRGAQNLGENAHRKGNQHAKYTKVTSLASRHKSNITVFFDGSCEPNPSYKLSYGGLILDHDGKMIYQISKRIEPGILVTNNTAEYCGIIACLQYLIHVGYQNKQILCLGDSQLVIKQLNGEWSINYDKPYGRFAKRASVLKEKFSEIHFEWIPRENNLTLSRQALL
jgi:ribonuclease HI